MKILSNLIILSCLIASCQTEPSPSEIILSKVETQVKEKMNDPESYELGSFEAIDTIRTIDNLFSAHSNAVEISVSATKTLSLTRRLYELQPTEKNRKDYDSRTARAIEYNDEVARITSLLEKADTLSNDAVQWLLVYRGNNKLGAKVRNEIHVQTSMEGDILKLTSERKRLLLYPGNEHNLAQ